MQLGHHLFSSTKRHVFPARWKRIIDRIMYIFAIVAPFSYAPQTYKIYSDKDASGLALATFVFLFFLNGLWLFYGLAHRSKPLIITSVLFCAFHIIIVTGILLY